VVDKLRVGGGLETIVKKWLIFKIILVIDVTMTRKFSDFSIINLFSLSDKSELELFFL
jgi:hypothetical protein